MNTSVSKFSSIFAPNLEVGIDAYITELLIQNHIKWYQNKGKDIGWPTCAFWRKDVVDKHKEFSELTQKYYAEISFVKDLRKCFSGSTIINYINEKGLTTFRFHKKRNQEQILFNLWKLECQKQKESSKNAKKTKEVKEGLTKKVASRKSRKNELSDIL